MKKILKWLRLFVPWALPIVIPLVWEALSEEDVSEWVRTTLHLKPWAALLIGVLIALTGMVVTAVVATRRERRVAEEAERERQAEAEREAQAAKQRAEQEAREREEAEWQAWRAAFRHAGPARDLDADTVAGTTRRMDQPFVDGVRTLARPVTLQSQQEERGGLVSTDAARYLREQIVERGRLGLLLQGRPLLGKTRFLVERLRQDYPEVFVLAPDPGRPIPAVPEHLAQHLGGGACLLLDDLERFEERVHEVTTLLDHLRRQAKQLGMPLLVLATVRDGGPGSTVQNEAAFRALREGLQHLELQPPSDDLIEEVGEQTHFEPRARGERERSFAFVLEKEFEGQRERYQALVKSEREDDRQAVRWLQAAKLLDDRSIPLERARLEHVAASLFGFEPGSVKTEAPLLVLKEQGFRDAQALGRVRQIASA